MSLSWRRCEFSRQAFLSQDSSPAFATPENTRPGLEVPESTSMANKETMMTPRPAPRSITDLAGSCKCSGIGVHGNRNARAPNLAASSCRSESQNVLATASKDHLVNASDSNNSNGLFRESERHEPAQSSTHDTDGKLCRSFVLQVGKKLNKCPL